MDTFNTYEDALTKELQVEMDEDYSMKPVDICIEEKLEIMHKLIHDLKLKGHDVWCTKCSMTWHTKYNF